jgi:hypothetical protein
MNRGIILDSETGDLLIKPQCDAAGKITSGMVIGTNIIAQNQYFILVAQPGEFKEAPQVGIGINNIVLDNDIQLWRAKIRQQFENDGMIISKLDIKNNELIVDAEYK